MRELRAAEPMVRRRAHDRALDGVRAVLRTNLALDPGEKPEVLLVTDEHHVDELVLIAKACKQLRIKLTSIVIPFESAVAMTSKKAFTHPLLEAIRQCRGMIVLTSYSVQTTPFRMAILSYFTNHHQHARAVSMPGVTLEHLPYALVNAKEIDDLNTRLARVLARTSRVSIHTSDGTAQFRLNVPVQNRPVKCGSTVDPGDWDNVPTGETYVLPRSSGSAGRLAVNGSIPGKALTVPVVLTIDAGRIVAIDSRDRVAEQYTRRLFFKDYPRTAIARNALLVAEVGFGVNRKIRRTHGVPVVDEKMYGTVHVGFGRNDTLGGRIKGSLHYDVVCVSSRVEFDGVAQPVLAAGRIHLPEQAVYLDWRQVKPAFSRTAVIAPSGHDARERDGELVFTVMHPFQKIEYRIGRPETARLCAEIYRALDRPMPVAALVGKLCGSLADVRVLAGLEVLRQHQLIRVRRQ